MRLSTCLLFATLLGNSYALIAQQIMSTGRVQRQVISRRIDDDAVIYDSTGRRMKLAEFAELNRADPQGHRLIASYDEYGKPSHYFYRPVTQEERETRRFVDRNPKLSPKAGEKMPPFVMQGADGKRYGLSDLVGKTVVLSFWLTLQEPGVNSRQIERLTQQLKPYLETGKLVSLGLTNDMPDELTRLAGTSPLPFVPVGDARGFAVRYHIVRFPTVIVIDKTGTVTANLHTIDMDGLGDIVKKLTN